MQGQRGFSFIELLLVTAIITILAGMAVPHLVKVKVTANEKTTMATMRTIFQAQAMHHARFQTYGELNALVENEFLDDSVGSGEKSGYSYTVPAIDSSSFAAVAVPLDYGNTGEKGFYIDQTGVIRYTENGSAPTASSPPWQ